ncbi:MAG: hypothetical protein WCI92_10520 [Bacteroidota bacterium]
MKLITRVFLILSILFILRVFTGCLIHDCPEEVYPFDFEKIEIVNLDNSGMWPAILSSDTLKRAAVAFQVSVSANLPLIGQSGQNSNSSGFSFPTASGKSDCPMLYSANHIIENISVVTAFDLNESYPANADVTSLFLGSDNIGYGSGLYVPIDELYQKINKARYYDYPETQFRLFYRRTVEKDSARFIIRVKLSDASILSDTTQIIHLR